MPPVDWYLEPEAPEAVGSLRSEIGAYLERHADPQSDIKGALLTASELVTNAVIHAGGPIWVSLTWASTRPQISVADLGPGFELTAARPADSTSIEGRGLYIVDTIADDLRALARRGAGTVVSASLPVTRTPEQSHPATRRRLSVLPALDEAAVDGTFGKEAFLRALVVQFAQVVEVQGGPDLAEFVVSQVGIDVGGQMELGLRGRRDPATALTPDELADCYVRLKHAIDGGFSVHEVTDERIVLVNDRCPFGDVVTRAPALCRMTSSVFGGIAARNSERGATVVLAERIAVGDPGCRVTVWLDCDSQDVGVGHRYEAPIS